MKRRPEAGSALVVALVAAGLFAYLSMLVVLANRGEAAMIQAQAERARLEAAADAGLVLALRGLGMEDQRDRWAIDGTAYRIRFDGVLLTIVVEDERGKVPIGSQDLDSIRRLLAGAGVRGLQLDSLTAAILDWMDKDNMPRTNGAEANDYRAAGADVLPRNGKIRSIEELLHVRGMTPQILARISPSVTLFFGEPGTFSEKTATPLAILAMLGSKGESLEDHDWEKELMSGAWPILENLDEVSLVGRPLTVRVQAELPDGARVTHATIIQFTGNPERPYWLRTHR